MEYLSVAIATIGIFGFGVYCGARLAGKGMAERAIMSCGGDKRKAAEALLICGIDVQQ